jgi:hypothetical protein
VVGFSEAEVKSGVILRSLGISEEGFKTVAALGKQVSALWDSAQRDRVEKRLIEVYFLDTGSSPNCSLSSLYGKQVRMVHSYNDTALEIINGIRLELPPILSTVARADLLISLGVGVRDYYFTIVSA